MSPRPNAIARSRTRSMHIALEDLGLEHLWVIYPGDQPNSIHDKMAVIPLFAVPQIAASIVHA